MKLTACIGNGLVINGTEESNSLDELKQIIETKYNNRCYVQILSECGCIRAERVKDLPDWKDRVCICEGTK